MIGAFKDGRGELFSADTFNDRSILVRAVTLRRTNGTWLVGHTRRRLRLAESMAADFESAHDLNQPKHERPSVLGEHHAPQINSPIEPCAE